MSFDEPIRQALDRAQADAQGSIDRVLTAFAEDMAGVVAEERARTAEVRRQADAQVTQLREIAQREIEEVERGAAASEVAHATRLAESIQALDHARSLGELLDTLAQCAGKEAERAAVFVVKGDRLQGWRLAGFGPSAPSAKSLDLDPGAAGVAEAAARSAAAVVADAAHPEDLPLFARTDPGRHAIAIPILVDTAVVAVLYADTPADAPPSRSQAVLDVLARHVSKSLEAMTVRQAAGLSLPRPLVRASQPPLSTQESGQFQ